MVRLRTYLISTALVALLGTPFAHAQRLTGVITIREGTAKPRGAQALKYCTPAQMKALPFCEADLPLLDVLMVGFPPAR